MQFDFNIETLNDRIAQVETKEAILASLKAMAQTLIDAGVLCPQIAVEAARDLLQGNLDSKAVMIAYSYICPEDEF